MSLQLSECILKLVASEIIIAQSLGITLDLIYEITHKCAFKKVLMSRNDTVPTSGYDKNHNCQLFPWNCNYDYYNYIGLCFE